MTIVAIVDMPRNVVESSIVDRKQGTGLVNGTWELDDDASVD